MAKKIPLRRCLVTGERLPKKDLLRIVRTPEGILRIDPTGKVNGRGAYIKKDRDVLPILRKKHLLEQVLGVQVPEAFYEELTVYLHELAG
ncbi:MAG: RNase P modulator RnpM [Bacilli bacterium]|jgi:predicted RNA-binding protein YlxR (DUF448 family)